MAGVTLFWTLAAELDEQGVNRAVSLVSRERAEKALRLRMDIDRKLSLAAELLILTAVKKDKIKMSYGEKGKPYVEGGPFFNISHSGEIVICENADREIGCDIEKIKEYNKSIPERFFSEGECQWIADSGGGEEAFFRIWTLKEAYIKATGQGLSLPLKDFSIGMGDDISVTGKNDNYSFCEPYVHQEYRCAVCVRGNEKLEVTVINVPLEELIGGKNGLQRF